MKKNENYYQLRCGQLAKEVIDLAVKNRRLRNAILGYDDRKCNLSFKEKYNLAVKEAKRLRSVNTQAARIAVLFKIGSDVGIGMKDLIKAIKGKYNEKNSIS